MKPVDLSVLIDSGIDVDDKDMRGVYYDPLFFNVDLYIERRSKPRMSYWFSNANDYWGGVGIDAAVTKLVDAGFDVDVNRQAYAFRIHGLRDNYCWPWEVEQ